MSKKLSTKQIQLTPIEYPQLGDALIDWFVEGDRKKAQSFLLDKGYDYEITGSGLTICRKGKDPIVWLHDKRPHVIAHEMIHAVKHIFHGLGHESITSDNDEIFAYLVDYAIQQVLNKRST